MGSNEHDNEQHTLTFAMKRLADHIALGGVNMWASENREMPTLRP